MKGNKKIKIIILLFIIVNAILLVTGFTLSTIREKSVDLILYNAITSDEFTRYSSDGKYNDFESYAETFEYKSVDTKSETIEEFHDTMFENGVRWSDLYDISVTVGGSIYDYFADPVIIEKVIMLEKQSTILDSDIKITDGLKIQLSMNGLENGLDIALFTGPVPFKTINILKLDLFTYLDVFSANGTTVDTTDGLDTDERKSIQDISDEEAKEFSESVIITLQIGDKGNEWLNYSTSQFLNSFEGNELFIWNNGLDTISKYSNESVHYDTFKTDNIKEKLTVGGSSGLIQKDVPAIVPQTKVKILKILETVINFFLGDGEEKELTSFEKPKLPTKLKTHKTESTWEQLLWLTYNELDYAKYFDNALIADGKSSYTLTEYYSELYGEEYAFAKSFEELGSGISNDLWNLGDKETTFSNYVALCNYYRPYIRTVNIDSYLKEISKIAASGINTSDLLKPNQI